MSRSTYRLLILGDFHFGESYGTGSRVIEEHGYEHSTHYLKPFVESADHFIVNLETPLVDPERSPSPLTERKKYIHWADPIRSAEALRDLGVDAVSLANNHTVDHGEEGLTSTFASLDKVGIPYFGAGNNISEAQRGYRIRIPDHLGSGEIVLHGSFQYSDSHEKFGFFAAENKAGCVGLSATSVPAPREQDSQGDAFHVAFPHWGANYDWRTPGQFRLSQRMLDRGFDLVLGHGSHMAQEVLRYRQRWVVFGIGNGIFQSGGRWALHEKKNGILPFSFWAVLEISIDDDGDRHIKLKLYPVYSDNSFTGGQPRPVDKPDFTRLCEALGHKSPNAWRFDNPSSELGSDHLGYYLQLDLGAWGIGEAPGHLPLLGKDSDPGDLPVRTSSPEILDSIQRLHKGGSFGPTLLAMAGEKHGASTEWISKNRAVITAGERRFLVDGYIAHESALGEQCCKDKGLTAQFLMENGISTPEGEEVTTVEDAIAVAARLEKPVVVKPVDGNKSRGVSVNLQDENDIRAAFANAEKISRRVLVQEYIDVEAELRILASPNEAYAVNKRLLPHVVGDGQSNISQLITDKNMWRDLNPSLHHRPIPVDELTLRFLSRNGRSLDDVPAMGEQVTVRDVGGLGAGGDTFQCFESTPEHVKLAAAGAVAAIPGLEWAGVDLIIEKNTGAAYVIEINTRAAYGAALTPTYGEPRDVAASLWNLRIEATAPEVTSQPSGPSLNRAKKLLGGIPIPDENVSLSRALFAHAANQGFKVVPHSDRLTYVTSPDGEEKWMTAQGYTAEDRSAVVQVLRRHGLTRQMLVTKRVPRTQMKRYSSRKELQVALRKIDSPVLLIPQTSVWGGARSRTIMPGESFENGLLGKGPWLVQSLPAGVRIRVFADRNAGWAVASRDSGLIEILSQETITEAAKRAVRAVRAVPELRWAAVDMVVPKASSEQKKEPVRVEGLSLNPTLTASSVLIAGSLTDFFDVLLGCEVPLPQAKGYSDESIGSFAGARTKARTIVRGAARRIRGLGGRRG